MKDKAENPPEEKPSRGFLGLLTWVAAILVVYILGIGPLMMLMDRGIINEEGKIGSALQAMYTPLEWAHLETPLHKPLGMYFHLWSKDFDQNGDVKNDPTHFHAREQACENGKHP
jgi:hypothetical protein